MKLRDLTADQILEELEKRSEALQEAEVRAAELDVSFKAYEAAALKLLRKEVSSDTQAEKLLRTQEAWAEELKELNRAVIEEKEKKRRYQRAEKALELWRSEQATIRAIEK